MTNFQNKKTEQQIYINKLEEIISKMQTNTSNLHENITKLKDDTEITKSKMFSYENISQNKRNVQVYNWT